MFWPTLHLHAFYSGWIAWSVYINHRKLLKHRITVDFVKAGLSTVSHHLSRYCDLFLVNGIEANRLSFYLLKILYLHEMKTPEVKGREVRMPSFLPPLQNAKTSFSYGKVMVWNSFLSRTLVFNARLKTPYERLL